MLTDLVQIRRLGEKKRDENSRLRLHLKRRNYQETAPYPHRAGRRGGDRLYRLRQLLRVATIKIIDRDVEKLAKRLGVGKDRFLTEYTREDEEEGAPEEEMKADVCFWKEIYVVCTTSGRILA